MGVLDLAVLVLQQIGLVAVEHARAAAGDRGRVQLVQAMARGLDPDQAHALVGQERVEHADGVGAAADAGDHGVGQAPFHLQDLLAGFGADHRLEVTHHRRIGMRTRGGADHVVGVVDVGDPVAQGLVHGVLEGRLARGHRPHLGAQQVHAEHVGHLPLDVDRAHVDHAGQAEAGGDGGRGHAVLAGAGLGDDAFFAHASRQQDLADAVVNLVRAGVVQLLALEIDLGPAETFGQALGEIERRGPADVVGQVAVQLLVELRIGLGGAIGLVEVQHQRHQGLGHIAPAELAEAPVGVGIGVEIVGDGSLDVHFGSILGWARAHARRTASRNAVMRCGSFTPGPRSTPEETSAIGARDSRMASATFQGSSPPARNHGRCSRQAVEQGPVEARAVAAGAVGALRRLGVEHQVVGGVLIPQGRGDVGSVAHADRLDHRQAGQDAHGGGAFRRLLAVQLDQVGREDPHDVGDAPRRPDRPSRPPP